MVEPPLTASVPSMSPWLHHAPVVAEGIVLANPAVVASYVGELDPNYDPLEALLGEFLDGMDDDTNIDMLLNLENIADIEMSTDSTKRKRS